MHYDFQRLVPHVMLLARSLFVIALALLISPACGAENKQEEGERLIRHAQEVSNIRAGEARPFRLAATFTLLGEGATAGEGTYTEIWGSRREWRRESVLGTFHRTEVAGEKTLWFLDSSEEVPGKAGQLGTLMHIAEVHQEHDIKVGNIRDEKVQGVHARCVEVRGGLGKETLCIDVQRGVLLEKKTPTLWMGKKSEYSCDYREYEQFAGPDVPTADTVYGR